MTNTFITAAQLDTKARERIIIRILRFFSRAFALASTVGRLNRTTSSSASPVFYLSFGICAPDSSIAVRSPFCISAFIEFNCIHSETFQLPDRQSIDKGDDVLIIGNRCLATIPFPINKHEKWQVFATTRHFFLCTCTGGAMRGPAAFCARKRAAAEPYAAAAAAVPLAEPETESETKPNYANSLTK